MIIKHAWILLFFLSNPLMGSSENKTYFVNLQKIDSLAVNKVDCLVTDRISIDGAPIGYMYRGRGENNLDNGWRFFAGDEAQRYVDGLSHTSVFDTNTIANHDPTILPYLDAPIDSEFERIKGTNKFRAAN